MAETIRVCSVNFAPVLGDKPATAAGIKATIEQAARDGCELVVLPEMALQGFEMCQACLDAGHACERHLADGELADGPLMRDIADLVRSLELYAIVGFGERDPVKPYVYNAAAVMGPDGLMGTTRKLGVGSGGRGPLNYEDTFSSGEAVTVYQTRFGPMGVGICYDMWINPESRGSWCSRARRSWRSPPRQSPPRPGVISKRCASPARVRTASSSSTPTW
jgi:predicted amidohydrolase